jgi:hypothetical protein
LGDQKWSNAVVRRSATLATRAEGEGLIFSGIHQRNMTAGRCVNSEAIRRLVELGLKVKK